MRRNADGFCVSASGQVIYVPPAYVLVWNESIEEWVLRKEVKNK